MVLWASVILLRTTALVHDPHLSLLWFAPNVFVAWFATGVFSRLFRPIGHRKPLIGKGLSVRGYLALCVSVVVLGFISEALSPILYSTTFDMFDMLSTVVAQTIAFSVPVLLKDKALVDFVR